MASNEHLRLAIEALFRSNNLPYPLSDYGAEFFAYLGFLAPDRSTITCMAENKSGAQCSNRIDTHEACNAATYLWSMTIDLTISDDHLPHKILEFGQHFLCKKTHRADGGMKHKLAAQWLPLVKDARSWYLEKVNLSAATESSRLQAELADIREKPEDFTRRVEGENQELRSGIQDIRTEAFQYIDSLQTRVSELEQQLYTTAQVTKEDEAVVKEEPRW